MPIWSSSGKIQVSEGIFGDFVKGLGDKIRGALDGLSKSWNNVKTAIAKMGKDALNSMRASKCLTDDNKLTGVGYKAKMG